MTTGKINQIARLRGEARARGDVAPPPPETSDGGPAAGRPGRGPTVRNKRRPTEERQTDGGGRTPDDATPGHGRRLRPAPTRVNAPTPPRRRPGGRPSTNRLPRQLRRGRRTTCRGQARRSHGHRRPHDATNCTTRTKQGGSVKTPSRSTPSLGANPAGCARTKTSDVRPDLDADRFNSRRTRACPGTLATGSCSLAVGHDRPGVRPSTASDVRSGVPLPGGKNLQNTDGRRGGVGGTPRVGVRTAGHLPNRR